MKNKEDEKKWVWLGAAFILVPVLIVELTLSIYHYLWVTGLITALSGLVLYSMFTWKMQPDRKATGPALATLSGLMMSAFSLTIFSSVYAFFGCYEHFFLKRQMLHVGDGYHMFLILFIVFSILTPFLVKMGQEEHGTKNIDNMEVVLLTHF